QPTMPLQQAQPMLAEPMPSLPEPQSEEVIAMEKNESEMTENQKQKPEAREEVTALASAEDLTQGFVASEVPIMSEAPLEIQEAIAVVTEAAPEEVLLAHSALDDAASEWKSEASIIEEE